MEKHIGAFKTRRKFGQLLEEAFYNKDSFIVQQAGRPMAVLVSYDEYQQWRMLAKVQVMHLVDEVWQRTQAVPAAELEADVAAARTTLRRQKRPSPGDEWQAVTAMKAVFDVGPLVSATINPHGHPGQLLTAWRDGKFELVTSPPILADLRRVLAYPHICKRHQWSDTEIDRFVQFLAAAALLTPGRHTVRVVTADPRMIRFSLVLKKARSITLWPAMVGTCSHSAATPGFRLSVLASSWKSSLPHPQRQNKATSANTTLHLLVCTLTS